MPNKTAQLTNYTQNLPNSIKIGIQHANDAV